MVNPPAMTKTALLFGALLSMHSALADLPERWICVNTEAVSGLHSLEILATAASDWRGLNIYRIETPNQSFESIASEDYPPAYTTARRGPNSITVSGGKSTLKIDTSRSRVGSFSSELLKVMGHPIRGRAEIFEATYILKTGLFTANEEIGLDCTAAPTE